MDNYNDDFSQDAFQGAPQDPFQDGFSGDFAGDFAGDFTGDFDSPLTPPRKGIGSKLWIGLGAGLLGIAMVVTALFFFLNRSTPLVSAARKTADAFSQIYEELPNVHAMSEGIQKAVDQDSFHQSLMVELETPDNRTASISLDVKHSSKLQVVDLSFGISRAGTLSLSAAATKNELLISLPQLWKNRVFTMSQDELADLMDADSFSFDKNGDPYKEFVNSCGDELQDFIKACKLEEDGTETVNGQTWTRYMVRTDEAKKQALLKALKAYLEESTYAELIANQSFMEQLDNVLAWISNLTDPTVCINEDGYLCDITLRDGMGDTLSFRLLGKENPWNDAQILANGELVLRFTAEITGNDLELALTDAAGSGVHLTYSDYTGRFLLLFDEDGERFSLPGTLRYSDKTMTLRLEPESEELPFALTYSFGQLDGKLKEPTGDRVGIEALLDSGHADHAALMDELQSQLFTNSDILGLIGWITGNLGLSLPF